MRTFVKLLAAVLALLALGSLAPRRLAAQTITCESKNNREQVCPADTDRGVRLVSQMSSQHCTQGETWGYDRQGVWVSGGCRARFEMDTTRNPTAKKSNAGAIAAGVIVAGIAGAVIANNVNHKKKDNRSSDYYRGYDDAMEGRWDRRNHPKDYKDGWHDGDEERHSGGRWSSRRDRDDDDRDDRRSYGGGYNSGGAPLDLVRNCQRYTRDKFGGYPNIVSTVPIGRDYWRVNLNTGRKTVMCTVGTDGRVLSAI